MVLFRNKTILIPTKRIFPHDIYRAYTVRFLVFLFVQANYYRRIRTGMDKSIRLKMNELTLNLSNKNLLITDLK